MRPAAQKCCYGAEACLRHGEHAVQRDQRVSRDLGVDGDLVDDLAPCQMLQRPEDVGGMDAVHRRAGADDRIEAEDVLVRKFRVEAVDQVDLGADSPGRPGGRAVMVSMMNSVEPSQSAWTTSSRHSGWTMMLTPGCSARAAAICSTEKRACTEQ